MKNNLTKSIGETIFKGKWELGHERRLTYQKMRMFNYAYQVPLPKYFGVKVLTELHRVRNGISSEYLEENELDEALKKITKILQNKKSQSLINRLTKSLIEGYARFKRFNKSLPAKYIKYSNNELIKTYKKFCREDEKISFPVWLIFTGFEQSLSKAIESFCLKNNIEAPDFTILSKPTLLTPLDLYTKDLSMISLLLKEKQEKALKSFYKKYLHWGMYDCIYNELPFSYYIEKLNTLSKESALNFSKSKMEEYKKAKRQKDAILDKYKKDKLLSSLLNLFHTIANFKDWKNYYREENSFKLKILLQEIAKRTGFSLDQISFMTESEISNIFSKASITADNLDKRKTDSLFIFSRKVLNILIDKEDFTKIDSVLEKDNLLQELKGQVAFKGIARGKVIIVISDADFNKVKEGTILVAGTTRPNFAPIMSKVKAIIVNEGGIISHTAILARELKIPCIIGTKIATKVLKDGDLVEVDAEKGVVRILN